MTDIEDILLESKIISRTPIDGPLKSVFFCSIWFGCSHSRADSESFANQLIEAGATLINDRTSEDITHVLITSCTVKNPSESHAYTAIRNNVSKGRDIIFAGCVPQSQPVLPSDLLHLQQEGRIAVTGTYRLGTDIAAMVQQMITTTTKVKTHLVRTFDLPQPRLLPVASRSRPGTAVIPLCVGCCGSCTYCRTVHSRGPLRSWPPHQLEQVFREAAADPSIHEVWLTGEDTLAWGRERGEAFPLVLDRMLAHCRPGLMVRVGMTDPDSVVKHTEALAQLLNHPHVYSFAHLPVQSASDQVLSHMRRQYTAGEFEEMVVRLRELVPHLTIATDFIAAYPTETEQDHRLSVEMAERLQFQVVNISQYYSRPGTAAGKLKRIRSHVVKARSRELTTAVMKGFDRARYVGTRHRIMVSERLPASSPRPWAGKTRGYLSLLLEPSPLLPEEALGLWVEVEVEGTTRVALTGRVLRVVEPSFTAVLEPS
eukprot:gnl/Dysnectes_brevis/4790_a6605_311.p1 GENE.gnl/Dysnectes_brevis/4790_a6605_311~~gnl/Dysnectes_brevis/4790_a6605_311.p1  ORF type:complete len:484 (+),score=175.02 gnl/Dysnectes_brevis/4790_a6605_311:211-1662(+)